MNVSDTKLFDGIEDCSFGFVIDIFKQHQNDIYDKPYMNPVAQRKGWNGKHMYIWLVPKQGIQLAHLNLFNAKGESVVGWLASQEDILADDWLVTTNRALL